MRSGLVQGGVFGDTRFKALGPLGQGLLRGVGAQAPEQEDEGARPGLRAIFILDLHLGTLGCQADALLDFLKTHPSDTLYLVGDIVDGWQLRRKWFWPQSHNDVVQKLLRRAELAPGATPEQLLALVGWPDGKSTVLVVGHQPTLGQTIARLLGLQVSECTVRKGTVWWLRSRERDGQPQTLLVAVQSPELL